MLQLHIWAGCVQAHAPKILSWCNATIGDKIRRKTRKAFKDISDAQNVGLGEGSINIYIYKYLYNNKKIILCETDTYETPEPQNNMSFTEFHPFFSVAPLFLRYRIPTSPRSGGRWCRKSAICSDLSLGLSLHMEVSWCSHSHLHDSGYGIFMDFHGFSSHVWRNRSFNIGCCLHCHVWVTGGYCTGDLNYRLTWLGRPWYVAGGFPLFCRNHQKPNQY